MLPECLALLCLLVHEHVQNISGGPRPTTARDQVAAVHAHKHVHPLCTINPNLNDYIGSDYLRGCGKTLLFYDF